MRRASRSRAPRSRSRRPKPTVRRETKTDRNGEFLQVGFASGRYNVTATKDNLKQSQPATVSQGTAGRALVPALAASGMTPEQAKAQQEMQAMAQRRYRGHARRPRRRGDPEVQRDRRRRARRAATAIYNLGVAYSKKKQYAEAEAAFKKAIELAPTQPRHTPGSPTSTTRRRSSTWRSRPAPRPPSSRAPAELAEAPRRSTTRASFCGTPASSPKPRSSSKRRSRPTRTWRWRTISSAWRT